MVQFVFVALFVLSIQSAEPAFADELIVCGWDEVFIIDVPAGELKDRPKKVWSWRGKECEQIPDDLKDAFGTTDECKPVDGGKRILITSSAGGVALVERESGGAVFWARVGNAHSAQMLPGGRIAVAGSVHQDGNCVALFDVKTPGKRLFSDELKSGHGVVWDAERKLLWALGYDELRAYSLADWDTAAPKLKREVVYPLPDAPNASGHDLQTYPGGDDLIVTSHHHVHVFDRAKRAFRKHEKLYDQPRVKSVSIHTRTGRVAYTQAEGDNWWTPRIRFTDGRPPLVLEGQRIYKVRWVQ